MPTEQGSQYDNDKYMNRRSDLISMNAAINMYYGTKDSKIIGSTIERQTAYDS